MKIISFIDRMLSPVNRSTLLKSMPFIFLFVSLVYLLKLHAEGIDNNNSHHQGDTIDFSGYKWMTKDSYGKITGPGNNYFSGTKENVFVDSAGRLHLRMTYRDDKWYCPEVRLMKSQGYGRYYFYLDPIPQKLDKDIVVGMFIYDREDTSNFHKEIDIEMSTWGKDSSLNSQYVIQPKEAEAHRFQTDLTVASRHMIELRRKKVIFKSCYDSAGKDDIPLEITHHQVSPDYAYLTNNERVSINVWLYHTVEPSNLKEMEVIVSRFEFKPFWYDRIIHLHKEKKEAK